MPTPLGVIRRISSAQFSKYTAATGEFVGIMTSETPDEDHEVMDYAQSKPYFEEWSRSCFKRSGGKNYGNVREMHGLSAAGKLTRPLQFDDRGKRIFVHGVIVDAAAKRKAEEGVYVGLSIGGRYVDRFPDPDEPTLTRYVADPTEVSLVDSPNNPDATLELVGATGTIKLLKFRAAEAGAPWSPLEEQDEQILKAAGLLVARQLSPLSPRTLSKYAATKRVAGKDLPASAFAYVGDAERTETWKYPIHDATHVKNALARWGQEKIPSGERERVYGRIKASAKRLGVEVTESAEKAIKSLYDVGGMATALQNLDYIRSCLAQEAEIERDESAVPGRLRDAMRELGGILKDLVTEETDELLAAAGVAAEE